MNRNIFVMQKLETLIANNAVLTEPPSETQSFKQYVHQVPVMLHACLWALGRDTSNRNRQNIQTKQKQTKYYA